MDTLYLRTKVASKFKRKAKKKHAPQFDEGASPKVGARGSTIQNHKPIIIPTVEDFEHHYKNCGLKMFQQGYEKLTREAKSKNHSIDEELETKFKKEGIDFGEDKLNTYREKCCRQFPYDCNPLDLAELGSGFVMYFELLRFLIILLGVLGIVQIPAMILYATSHSASDLENPRLTPLLSCTPGNITRFGAEHSFVPAVYCVCIVFFVVATLAMVEHLISTDKWVDHKTAMPSDFAILVRGIKDNKEENIRKWFEQHAREAEEPTPVVKVVIGFNYRDWKKMSKQVQSKKDNIERLTQRGMQHIPSDEDMRKAQDALEAAKRERYTKVKSSGTVVIVFEQSDHAEACLERWNHFWARWSLHDARDVECLPKGNRLVLGNPLPMYSKREFHEQACVGVASSSSTKTTFSEETRTALPGALSFKTKPKDTLSRWRKAIRKYQEFSVKRAPEPGDILWEELGHSRMSRTIRAALSLLVFSGLIALSFYCVQKLYEIRQEMRDGADEKDRLLALIPACAVSIINLVMGMVSRWLGDFEIQDSYTEQEFSQAFKMTIAMTANIGVMILVIDWRTDDWYTSRGLVENLVYMQVIDAIVARIVLFIDWTWLMNKFYRWQTKRKIEQWKKRLNQDPPLVGGEQAAEAAEHTREEVATEIEDWYICYEPEEIDNPDRYARLLVTFLCSVFYAPLFPPCVFIGIGGLVLQYSMDKWLLIRWYRRPHNQNKTQAFFVLRVVKMTAPALLALGLWLFLSPAWNDQSLNGWFIAAAVIVCLTTLVIPQTVLIYALGIKTLLRKSSWYTRTEETSAGLHAGVADNYYRAQHYWPDKFRYHRDNFFYRALPSTKNKSILVEGENHDYKPDAADTEVDLGEEDDAMTGKSLTSRASRSSKLSRRFRSVNDLVKADGCLIDTSRSPSNSHPSADPASSISSSGLQVQIQTPRSTISETSPIKNATLQEDDLDLTLTVGVKDTDTLNKQLSFSNTVPTQAPTENMPDLAAEELYEEQTQPNYSISEEGSELQEDSSKLVSWRCKSRKDSLLLHQRINSHSNTMIECVHNDVTLDDNGLIYPIMVNTEGVR